MFCIGVVYIIYIGTIYVVTKPDVADEVSFEVNLKSTKYIE